MTFIQRIESLSSRFFSERTYELIVEPALADLQHDAGADDGRYSMGGRLSVLIAFAGAVYEELTADSTLLKLAGLAFIPGLYYAFLIVLVLPAAGDFVLALIGAIAVLSLGPVLVCCWPERAQRRRIQPDAADA